MRLRNSLLLLAAATAVPLVAFVLLAANVVNRQENDSFINAAKARNRATMSAVDGLVLDAINTLRAFTVTPSLKSDDFEAFHTLSRDVLATQPVGTTCCCTISTDDSWSTRMCLGALNCLRNLSLPIRYVSAVSTGQPAVDDLAPAPLLQNRLGIPVRVPVMRDGTAVYVLTAVLAPDAFQQLLVAQNLPPNWVSGVVDRQGRLIARVPSTKPGTMAGAGYLDQVKKGGHEGWYRGKTLEGEDAYTAFLRSDLTGWTIGYALPATAFIGGWRRAGWLMTAGAILSLIAAVTIGVWLSRRIATPMSQLADAAGAIGGSTVPPRVESKIDEVMALSTR